MLTLNGHSTSQVKLQVESIISYNMGIIKDVGSFAVSAPGSGTQTNIAPVAVGGANLVVRANTPIESDVDIVVTIAGTGDDNAAMTGTATIEKQVAEGQSYQVVPARDGIKFKAGAAIVVTITGGVLGDGFDIVQLPDSANDVEILFDQGLTINPGKEVKPIYHKYILDHNKRVRGDRTMSISGFYVNNKIGLARINNRECTLIQSMKDNGAASITEVIYIEKCRLGNTREAPSAEDGELTNRAEGTYGRLFIFS